MLTSLIFSSLMVTSLWNEENIHLEGRELVPLHRERAICAEKVATMHATVEYKDPVTVFSTDLSYVRGLGVNDHTRIFQLVDDPYLNEEIQTGLHFNQVREAILHQQKSPYLFEGTDFGLFNDDSDLVGVMSIVEEVVAMEGSSFYLWFGLRAPFRDQVEYLEEALPLFLEYFRNKSANVPLLKAMILKESHHPETLRILKNLGFVESEVLDDRIFYSLSL